MSQHVLRQPVGNHEPVSFASCPFGIRCLMLSSEGKLLFNSPRSKSVNGAMFLPILLWGPGKTTSHHWRLYDSDQLEYHPVFGKYVQKPVDSYVKMHKTPPPYVCFWFFFPRGHLKLTMLSSANYSRNDVPSIKGLNSDSWVFSMSVSTWNALDSKPTLWCNPNDSGINLHLKSWTEDWRSRKTIWPRYAFPMWLRSWFPHSKYCTSPSAWFNVVVCVCF